MKTLILAAVMSFSFFALANTSATAENSAFRSTWRVSPEDNSITLPLVKGYKYDFTVDWGDGQSTHVDSYDDLDATHFYAAGGEYNLVIEGILEAWSFGGDHTFGDDHAFPHHGHKDKNKILSVENFGDLAYKDLRGAFWGCTHLSDFKGGVTSGVNDMAYMFYGAGSATPEVNEWDVSNVTTMEYMFSLAEKATPKVSQWETSKVTDMSEMFYGAVSADPDVRKWDVSSVIDMTWMFAYAKKANPDISHWKTSSLMYYEDMFKDSLFCAKNSKSKFCK